MFVYRSSADPQIWVFIGEKRRQRIDITACDDTIGISVLLATS